MERIRSLPERSCCLRRSITQDYTFDIDPTPESNEYDAGYRRAYGGKRAMSDSVLNGKSEHYRDGYQDGMRDKKRYTVNIHIQT